MDIILGLVIIDVLLIIVYAVLTLFSQKLKIKKELILALIHIIEIVTAGLVGYVAGKGGI